MKFAKASEVKAGDVLVADGGFDCIKAGARLTVEADAGGELFVPCKAGRHYLDGQIADVTGALVGLSKPDATPISR